MQTKIVYKELPSLRLDVEFKLPYTRYTPPTFDIPEFLFEVWWIEEPSLVISKFIYATMEETEREFRATQQKWYGAVKNPIDKALDKRIKQIQKEAHESRLNYKRAERVLKEFYPIRLREYMERMRRMNYVKAKRKREKMKIMSMIPEDADLYIDKKIKELGNN